MSAIEIELIIATGNIQASYHWVSGGKEVRNKAHIFGQSGKLVNKYQERINDVAGDICVHDPALLAERGRLLELAKDRVQESGYVYVKGKSRLKKFTFTEHEEH